MKKSLIFLLLVGVSLAMASCSEEEELKEDAAKKASIFFGAILQDMESNQLSKQSLEELPECSDNEASYVRILLSRDEVDVVGSQEEPFRIDLVEGQIFTEEVPELELTPGSYSLDYFGVYNEAGELIWLAPTGGIFSEYFENPLPMAIDLNSGVKKYVEVSVICFDERFVNEYGYLFFDLDTNQAIEFCIFGNYCGDNGRHYPAAFSVDIWLYNNGENGAQLYSGVENSVAVNDDGDYAGTPLCFALPDSAGEDEYYIEISLLNSDAYGDVTEEGIRAGVITDEDVRSLFDGGDATEYFHFREGACNLNDSPDLFDDGLTQSYSNEAVLAWNELIAESINQRFSQPVEVRVYAMITLAMHDALNNVIPKFETYALDNSQVNTDGYSQEELHAIADAAVSQAARNMLVQFFPAATAAADELLSTMLSEIDNSDLETKGTEIGKDAAAAVLAKRANDPALSFVSYSGGTEPGEYQANYPPFVMANPPVWPANAIFAPNLGDLAPFGIQASDQFIDEAPHHLNSEEYLADYNEVKSLGCINCPARTAEQTEIGTFWLETSSSILNRITRDLIVQEGLDGYEAAWLIGLIQMSAIDAYIASFEEKFHFTFWRPTTAIRAGDSDGVEATIGDETWAAFAPRPVPPNPQFPSSHAYSAGAAAEIFKSYFNSDQTNITVTSPYNLPGVERQMSSFSQIAHEKGVYGIFIGYDFRQGVEVGEKNGRELGAYLFENALREIQ